MSIESLKSSIRTIPGFPIKGIQYRDLTTLFKDPKHFAELCDRLYEQVKDKGITKVVGLESRGFIMGSILAERLGVGFVLARKAGKLPAPTAKYIYKKEYGDDILEIHKDAIGPDDVVLIHDDILATGGSINSAINLVRSLNAKKIYANFILQLDDLGGGDTIPKDVEFSTVLHMTDSYEE